MLVSTDTRLDVVVRGMDNGIYHASYVGTWSGWESLGGSTVDAPTLAVEEKGLHVFVRGTDNGVYQNSEPL
jgi:hypothetical protein